VSERLSPAAELTSARAPTQRLGPMQEWIRQSEGYNNECSDQRGNPHCDKN
jgi:hypothetical protein